MMRAMRALIVARTDSPACALAQRLVEAAGLQLLAQARSAAEALTLTLALRPELLLLDPELKPVSAAELAASLPHPAPRVAGLTDELVCRCIAAGDAPRVAAALCALPRRRLGGEVTQLLVPEQGRFTALPLADIRWIELPDARHALLRLQSFREQHVLHRRLADLLEDLPPGMLLRCQTRVAVAPAHVLEALPRDDGRATLLLDNGSRLACGAQYWPALAGALREQDKPVAPIDRPPTPSRWSAPWRLDGTAG